MEIGIDLDNCLNNMNSVWVKEYCEKFNDNLTIDDVHCWDIHKYTKSKSKDIYSLLTNSFFDTLSPLPQSIEATQELSEDHELFVVTATTSNTLHTKVLWLEKYFPHIPKENIISTYRKDLVNVDLLIDDASHNIISFPNRKIVFDYPWNRDLLYEYPRAKNWLEILDIIDSFHTWDHYTSEIFGAKYGE